MNEETKRVLENHYKQLEEAAEAAALAHIPRSEIEDGSHRARIEAQQSGWAGETTDGERILVVKKTSTAAGDILEDADGNSYIARPSSAAVNRIDRREPSQIAT